MNYAGLALIVVGVGLMVAEVFSPGVGVFGVGGVISFVIGSVILMDTDLPGYQISIPIIAAFAAASLAFFLFVIGAAIKARSTRVVTGRESMIGAQAVVLEDFHGDGLVRLYGEIWQAASSTPLTKNTRVRVVAIDGLVLRVEPLELI
ncbi:MAG: NfeD family protein [Gammaproteobacteria bacterium]